jgi:preprotein translocase subunit SecG
MRFRAEPRPAPSRVSTEHVSTDRALLPGPRRRPLPSPHRRRSGNLRPVETILSVLQVAISVVVIFLVLMHSGKDSGLSGAFGVGSGTGPLGGGYMVERNLNRWTIFFAILFLINAIVLLKRPWA